MSPFLDKFFIFLSSSACAAQNIDYEEKDAGSGVKHESSLTHRKRNKKRAEEKLEMTLKQICIYFFQLNQLQ
jgi:hypothetical protein